MHFVHVNIWLMLEVVSKWAFMGRRKEGRFNYDTSTYGQNWEVCRDLTSTVSALDFSADALSLIFISSVLPNLRQNSRAWPYELS